MNTQGITPAPDSSDARILASFALLDEGAKQIVLDIASMMVSTDLPTSEVIAWGEKRLRDHATSQ